jgi:hypothetical protein
MRRLRRSAIVRALKIRREGFKKSLDGEFDIVLVDVHSNLRATLHLLVKHELLYDGKTHDTQGVEL